MIEVLIIDDPSPVWDQIKAYMVDDSEMLATEGQFLGAFMDGELAGAWIVKPWNAICYEIHGGVSPKWWGHGQPEALYRALGDYLFLLTPCLKIIAIVPACNRLILKMVKALGFHQEGFIPKSFLKRMRLHDQYLFGISKSEVKPCQPLW